MNTKNNKKYQETEKLICHTFIDLLGSYDFDDINVSVLCKNAGVTRATFYSHFGEINHFYDVVAENLLKELAIEDQEIFKNCKMHDDIYHDTMISFFKHILRYRAFYNVYVEKVHQLPFFTVYSAYTNKEGLQAYAKQNGINTKKKAIYLSAFHYTGLTAMIRVWLESDCEETPEELYDMLMLQFQAGANRF